MTPQATNEELEEATKARKATSAKTKAKPPKHVRSPQKQDQASPNPAPQKRVKGKQPEADQQKIIQELMKVSLSVDCILSWIYKCCNSKSINISL